MPKRFYKRKFNYRKRTYRIGRPMGVHGAISTGALIRRSAMRSLRNPNHVYSHLCRTTPFGLTNNNLGAGLGSVQNLYFRFTDVINAAEFSVLYDSYRVRKVVFTLIPYANVGDVSGLDSLVNPGWMPYVFWNVDFDDIATPAYTTMLETANMKMSRYGKILKLTITPHFNIPTAGGGLENVASPSKWLDIATPNVEHMGIKMFIQDANVGTATLYTVITEAHLDFRGAR